jgi:hypothetical protein
MRSVAVSALKVSVSRQVRSHMALKSGTVPFVACAAHRRTTSFFSTQKASDAIPDTTSAAMNSSNRTSRAATGLTLAVWIPDQRLLTSIRTAGHR